MVKSWICMVKSGLSQAPARNRLVLCLVSAAALPAARSICRFAMSRVLQMPLGSSATSVMENYTLGDVLICKANRGKLLEVMHLVDTLQADVNYRNQVRSLPFRLCLGCTLLWVGGRLCCGRVALTWRLCIRMDGPKDDQTPLHYAAFYGHLEVVQFLVEHGVPLDAPDKFTDMKQFKALLAELTLSWAIRDWLLGADLDEQDNKTAYQIAKDKHKQKCVQQHDVVCLYGMRMQTEFDLSGVGVQTNKSPSRCAFEAGHSSLANYLQAWEEGNDDYSTNDEATTSALEYDGSRAVGEDEDNSASRSRSTFTSCVYIREDCWAHLSTLICCRCCCYQDIDTVYNWLKFFKMDEYTRNFEKDGFDTLRGVATIDEEDLIDMKVKKGHRRVVLSHIEELRTQLALLDESAQVAGQEPHSSPTLGMLPQITKQSSLSNLITAGGAPAAAVAGSETAPHRTERRGSVSAAPMDV
ncbi:hypothetical protein BBJ28_00005172 [Nothophytophthora sp. Chile5]|nr:hypothetical protein BBJ28_00005172 [Nothophytophthora sp. Chile5]